MSTSQGTYVRIEQTSEAIRVTKYAERGGGARGLELRTADLRQSIVLFVEDVIIAMIKFCHFAVIYSQFLNTTSVNKHQCFYIQVHLNKLECPGKVHLFQ